MAKCDGWCEGANPVAMIGNKGYAYCKPCGLSRRASGYERTRLLKPHELKLINSGQTLPKY